MGKGLGTQGNDLKSTINHLHDTEKRWFAVNTRYRSEKYVARHLKKKGIEVYIPLIEKVKKYQRKTKKYQIPLINCFVFVHITRGEYIPILETEYVIGFLKQRKDLVCVPESEIDMIRRVVGEIRDVNIQLVEYQSGSEVEVVSGTLTGLRGKLIEQKGKNTFVVELQSIGYQMVMEIDRSLLRPLFIQQGA